jgi:hypothetical protein
VHGQQDDMPLRRQLEHPAAQQRAGRQIKTGGGQRAQMMLDLGVLIASPKRCQIDAFERERPRRINPLDHLVTLRHKARAQAFVSRNYFGETKIQQIEAKFTGDLDRAGDGVGRPIGKRLVEKPQALLPETAGMILARSGRTGGGATGHAGRRQSNGAIPWSVRLQSGR